MFESLQTVIVHKVRGREINEFIEAATGQEFDPVSAGIVSGNDSWGTLTVDVLDEGGDHEREEFEKFRATGDGVLPWVLVGFLQGLAREGKIPFGQYQLVYTWG